MKMRRKKICIAIGLPGAFVLWTVLVRFIGVEPIGPNGVSVGFAALNGWAHSLIGVNMALYTVTDWLGLVPIAVVLSFGIMGLVQWIVRKSILKVDRDILALGVFYVTVVAAFIFFETVVINYRPVLIEGRLEASYPSSTTLLVGCVMPTAAMQIRRRIKALWLKRCIIAFIAIFTVFTVVARIISGVHWITDIIGGLLLSGGLVTLYGAFYRSE